MGIPITVKDGKTNPLFACAFAKLEQCNIHPDHVHTTMDDAFGCLLLYVRYKQRGASDEEFLVDWSRNKKQAN